LLVEPQTLAVSVADRLPLDSRGCKRNFVIGVNYL
jgi:hypothetical protein